jgi:hypothetical protein
LLQLGHDATSKLLEDIKYKLSINTETKKYCRNIKNIEDAPMLEGNICFVESIQSKKLRKSKKRKLLI